MKNELAKLTLQLRKERSPLAATFAFHMSEVSKIGKSKGNRETTEDEAIQYVKRAVAGLKADLHANQDELRELEALLPQMASREDVAEFLKTIDTSNKGFVMKCVKSEFGALVDMKMVSEML